MTADTEHTHGFYLIIQHRIHREVADNRSTHRYIVNSTNTYATILQLMNKYMSNNRSSNKCTNLITHHQAVKARLDKELGKLQSESDRLNTYLYNNDDIAGRAYEEAYATPIAEAEHETLPCPNNIFLRIVNFFTPRTK